jgi:hypothetical protein
MSTGSERFARRSSIPDHWIGIRGGWEYFCRSFGEALVSLPPEDLKTHALVIGSTGSGKTVCLHHLIAQDLMRGHSIVVLDARGDLGNAVIELAARAKLRPERVKLFNLREKVRPLGFNPLSGGGEPYYRALGVLDAVAAESESWGVQLAETLRNALLLLSESGASLTQLDALFFDATKRKLLLSKASSAATKSFWKRYATPVLNKVSLLLSTDALRRLYGHPEPLDLARHLATPGSVTLISLAVDEVHGAGWMTGSLFLSAICREIFSQVDVAESMRNPVRLYVDEFEHFNMREFETILAEGRRFKFSMVLAHQTLAQLTTKMRSVILGNVGVKLIFRTSHQDADALSRDLAGDSKAFEIASLEIGEAVFWRRGQEPIYIEVNAPLIQDVGSVSPRAREFMSQIRDLTPPFFEDDPDDDEGDDENEGPKPPPSGPKSLGDWL